MDIATKIIDAVVPDPGAIPQTQSTEPENEIPGAFPDADDEALGRELEGGDAATAKTTQGHRYQDSAVDIDEASSRTAGRETNLPETASVPPASGSEGDVSAGGSGARLNVGTGSSADGMTAVEEVKPRYLGNEGKVLGTTGSSGVGTGALASTEQARQQGLGEEGAGVPALETARPSVQDDDDAGIAAETGGNTHEKVLLEAASDLSEGASQQSRDTAPDAAAAGFSGGIHNGVLGAGSDDPLGERSGSPHERSTQYRKGDVQNVISGVSQSGLGQGGIHNGVVGLGSQEEEAIRRHSLENQGQNVEE